MIQYESYWTSSVAVKDTARTPGLQIFHLWPEERLDLCRVLERRLNGWI
jgi:hypothetical protein